MFYLLILIIAERCYVFRNTVVIVMIIHVIIKYGTSLSCYVSFLCVSESFLCVPEIVYMLSRLALFRQGKYIT